MVITSPSAIIDENGVSTPQFSEILDWTKDRFRSIYGSDFNLDNDQIDGQWLGVLSLMLHDSNQSVVAVYNQFSPQSAVGVGLSQVVKVNGLRRLVSSQSTIAITVIGVAGTTVSGGIVSDILNRQWILEDFTIPDTGSIVVTGTCQTDGAIALAAFSVLTIVTAVPGWQTATTSAAATPGAPVETDSALRQRQAISTAQPALTPLEAIVATVANLSGVQRVKAYQNDTLVTDGFGIPAHSISLVIRGGDAIEIATAIANKKTPGTGTYGSTTEIIVDDNGIPNTIKFQYEVDISIYLLIELKALTGYLSTTGDALESSLVYYINQQPAGVSLYHNRLWSAANLTGSFVPDVTGYDQATLNQLITTYNINILAHARSDMATVTAGALPAGSTSVALTNAASITIGDTIYMILDNLVRFTATVTNKVSNTITFTPAIPASRSVPNGSIVYTTGNLSFAFNEAPISSTNIVSLTVV
jgi:uncharacterized phage protein gp47/JayE